MPTEDIINLLSRIEIKEADRYKANKAANNNNNKNNQKSSTSRSVFFNEIFKKKTGCPSCP